MAYDFQVTVDCSDPHVLADWWAEALGWTVEPGDEDFIRRMISEGNAVDDDTTIHHGLLVWKEVAAIRSPLDPAFGSGGRRVMFQLVPEPRAVKNRLHFDVNVGQEKVEAEMERLMSAGATFLHLGRLGPESWVTMADPEGNEFCVA